MSILVTNVTLKLLGRTLETLHMFGISLGTSIFSCMGLFRIKFLLVGWHLLSVFTWIQLVLTWKIVSSCAYLVEGLCTNVSPDWFGPLGVTYNLFDVTCCSLWNLHLLCKLPDFACRKPFPIYTAIIFGFGHKLFFLQEEPKYVKMQDVCNFFWVFGKRHLCLYYIVPLIYRSVTLSEACKQVKSGSDFTCLRLAKVFILGPYCIQAKFFSRNHQETYWSILKSPLQAMNFLHFFDSEALHIFSQEYFHTSASTSRTCDTSHHSLSNPSWDPLYKE